MADNVELPSGSGGAIIATDDDGVAQHQYVKLEFGADNTQTKVSSANPLPVVGASNSGVDIGDVTVNNGVGASAVPIQDGGNSITVDGTVAVTSAGITTIAGAVAGTEMQVDVLTMPTVTVNAHAVTNAGTFAVQESGTQVQVDDAAFAPATSKILMAGFEYDDTLPDVVDEGDGGAARMSANRNQYVQIRDNAGNERGLNIDANGEIQISGTRNALAVDNAGLTELAAAINASSQMDVNIAASAATLTVASHAVTNAGTFAVQVDGAALTALQLIDDTVFAEDVAAQAADKGVAILAVRRDADTSLVGTDNDYANLQVDANGYLKVEVFDGGGSHTVDNAGTFAVQAVLRPETSGGLTIFRSIDIDETEEEVKATAGQVYAIHCMNLTNALLYLKFYNATAANVTVGTTTPVLTFPVAGNNDSDGAGFVLTIPQGIAFGTAISVAATTGIADADTGAPAANACAVQVLYA